MLLPYFCLFPALALLLASSESAPTLLMVCSWSAPALLLVLPTPVWRLHHQQHFTTFFGTAIAAFYGIGLKRTRTEFEIITAIH